MTPEDEKAKALAEEIAIISTEQVLAGCKTDMLWTLFHVRNTRTLLAMAKRALAPAPVAGEVEKALHVLGNLDAAANALDHYSGSPMSYAVPKALATLRQAATSQQANNDVIVCGMCDGRGEDEDGEGDCRVCNGTGLHEESRQQAREWTEDELFELIMNATDWQDGGCILPKNARKLIRALAARGIVRVRGK